MNCGKCSNLHCRRYDMPYPCSLLATLGRLHSGCLLLLLIFLSGSGDLSDTRAWKELIKRSYCQRWPYRDATVWLIMSFTADKKHKETDLGGQCWEITLRKLLGIALMRETILFRSALSWTAKSHKEDEYVTIYFVSDLLNFLLGCF